MVESRFDHFHFILVYEFLALAQLTLGCCWQRDSEINAFAESVSMILNFVETNW